MSAQEIRISPLPEEKNKALQAAPPSSELASETTDASKIKQFLREFDEKRKSLVDYEAHFSQKRTSPVFNEQETAYGSVRYKNPKKVLWSYDQPDKIQLLIKEDKILIYTRDLEQLEEYSFEERQGTRGFFLGFGESAAALEKDYEIALFNPAESDQVGIVLTPKRPTSEELAAAKSTTEVREMKEGKPFERLKLWLSKKDFSPLKILIEGAGRDETFIEFSDITTNRSLSDDDFVLKIPEGTRVFKQSEKK